MSLDQLKDELTRLPQEEQREVITFLLACQKQEDDEFAADPAEGDDRAHWGECSELKKKVAE